jgi:hypothetical protein
MRLAFQRVVLGGFKMVGLLLLVIVPVVGLSEYFLVSNDAL